MCWIIEYNKNSSDLTSYLGSSFKNNKVDTLDVVFKLIKYLKTMKIYILFSLRSIK